MKTVLMLCLMIFVFASCQQTNPNEQNKQPASAFCITDSMMHYVQISEVSADTVVSELSLSGKVQAIPSKNIKIYPLVSGLVKEVFVELGDYVSKGQRLAIIQSGEVAGFERELADAESNYQIALKNADVARDMYESKLISQKEFIAAQKEVNKAEAELKRLKMIFSIYDIDEFGQYILKAPIAGYITTKNISPGMQIRSDNTEEMFTISDIDEVWVIANVYETDMRKIKVGESVKISTIAYPDTCFTGRIDKVFEVLDPLTRVMKVAIKLENKSALLKPEMYAKVIVQYRENRQMPYIPANSVIFDKGKYYVLVFKKQCQIEIRQVDIHHSIGDKTFIQNGLSPHEKIITNNQLLIYDAMLGNN